MKELHWSTPPAILEDSWCLIAKCSEVRGDPKQRKWRKQVSWCPDWNSYARTRHKPLHYLGQAPSPGKGKARSLRQEGEVLSGTGACDVTRQQKAATREASRQGGEMSNSVQVTRPRWLCSKTAQRSGYHSSRQQSLLSSFCQIPDQREVKWCQQCFLGWEDQLVQAGKTDLKKIKRAWVSYR